MMAESGIYAYNRMSLGVILLLRSFSNGSVWFPPTSQAYLVSGSWPPKQCQALAPSHGKDLKTNQEWLGIPITFVPLLYQHVMQEGLCCGSKDV